MNTYNPQLDVCYECRQDFQSGDLVLGFYEHYMHVRCAPLFIAETKRWWKWKPWAGQ